MAYTGMAAFRTALASLPVTGIAGTSRLKQAPTTLSVRLPCSFPRLPVINGEVITLGSSAGLRAGTLELVVVVQAVNLATNPLNLDAVCTLMDALDDALRAATVSLGLDRWGIRGDIEEFGETPYWVLIATVEASG